jgi:glutaredoxin-related protein
MFCGFVGIDTRQKDLCSVPVFQVPRIFVRGECLGGCSDVEQLSKSGKLAEIVEAE